MTANKKVYFSHFSTTGDILLEANGIILTGLTNNVSIFPKWPQPHIIRLLGILLCLTISHFFSYDLFHSIKSSFGSSSSFSVFFWDKISSRYDMKLGGHLRIEWKTIFSHASIGEWHLIFLLSLIHDSKLCKVSSDSPLNYLYSLWHSKKFYSFFIFW